MNEEMLDIIEDDKKVYVVLSANSGNTYSLMIFKEKDRPVFKIINLTKGYICPCDFDTYQEAVDDIYKYQSQGKNQIIDIHSLTI